MLRITFGVNFLMGGIGKFMMGIGDFEAGLEKQFAGKLPVMLLKPFGYALPFAELIEISVTASVKPVKSIRAGRN